MAEAFSFFSPLKINCGSHALDHLPFELAVHGARAPLILASPEQVDRPRLAKVVNAFKTSGLTLGIYDRLADRQEADLIPLLAQMFRDGNCDSLVAVGSGAVVDAAKCLNLAVPADPFNGKGDRGRLRPLMLVAIPGGNGDEATGYASDGKQRLASAEMVPSVVFIDPEMMHLSDERAIVNAALVALVHAVEAFLEDSIGPPGHAYAIAAIGLIMENLPAVLHSHGAERRRCLQAVVNGQVAAGIAFYAAEPGICHGLSLRLKAATPLPEGFLMATLLPHLLEIAASVKPQVVGRLLDPIAGSEVHALTADELKAARATARIWEFFESLNAEMALPVPTSLADAGISEAQLNRILSTDSAALQDDAVKQMVARAQKGICLVDDPARIDS
ncbi:alcohol dehydrogenase EutG [Desulfosarcina ovata subsp. sediminis]|uniref:Alcohol dehydrogenase EutG n=1 Tax=Desulfosarcina ovata subsp. sediminis TaxID=885957 RepID=A0A5K7ZK31_9BACT|nr:iron-containing alcohol dehydrogenase [Desulfosarcina ovata]BBO80009.1 alcohol dehydrogenase EutG [Desulfosarcina ovata subsp. sediminis]